MLDDVHILRSVPDRRITDTHTHTVAHTYARTPIVSVSLFQSEAIIVFVGFSPTALLAYAIKHLIISVVVLRICVRSGNRACTLIPWDHLVAFNVVSHFEFAIISCALSHSTCYKTYDHVNKPNT